MKIYRLRSKDDELALIKKATAEGHGLYRPTHIMVSDDEKKGILGYLSLSPLPFVAALWASKEMTALDSTRGIQQLGAFARIQGHSGMIFRCDTESPYFAQMERLGFGSYGLGKTNLFELDLTQKYFPE